MAVKVIVNLNPLSLLLPAFSIPNFFSSFYTASLLTLVYLGIYSTCLMYLLPIPHVVFKACSL